MSSGRMLFAAVAAQHLRGGGLFTTAVIQTAATALHPSYAGSLSSSLMLCAAVKAHQNSS